MWSPGPRVGGGARGRRRRRRRRWKSSALEEGESPSSNQLQEAEELYKGRVRRCALTALPPPPPLQTCPSASEQPRIRILSVSFSLSQLHRLPQEQCASSTT